MDSYLCASRLTTSTSVNNCYILVTKPLVMMDVVVASTVKNGNDRLRKGIRQQRRRLRFSDLSG